ncbi:MAG: hypothetical protein ACK5EU_12595 [Pseudanabaena sp.]|jgi:hypothetical protein|nr:hypothetical protein [Pseudanabaena sp. M53BS1SP1A06MG]MCA6582766.1 hypothetical protein [Pseudanabaena sp. M34BS1SP1A06MG]MCA6591072.1 hypothetical protein [Pseudanabaena sp. M38BS1SP1A06MG]MCA6599170.1 hypothetical protein [Pseudanabaena sp. M57BS1SP1A06MG]
MTIQELCDVEVQDLVKEFGYSFERKWLNLPQYTGELDRSPQTQERIEEILPYVSLTSDRAKREILVSPIIRDLIHYTKAKVRIEYPIQVTEKSQQILDYFIKSNQCTVITFAKGADTDFGMTELIASLIALDRWLEDPPQTNIIGAVTTGRTWEFARLNRQSKHIEQGLEMYDFFKNFDALMRILVQVVTGIKQDEKLGSH